MKSKDVIKKLGEATGFDSAVVKRWEFTGRTSGYVQYNAGTKGKVVYQITARSDGFEVKLLIGSKDARVGKFKEKQKCSPGVGSWFENARDAGVCEFVSDGISYDDAVKKLAGIWDKYYSTYNEALFGSNASPACAPLAVISTKLMSSSPSPAVSLGPITLEKTEDAIWQDYLDYWDGFVREWFGCKENGNPCALPEDKLTKMLAQFFAPGLRGKGVQLLREELPEPYCGNWESAKGVVVQLNPGNSEPSEDTKYYDLKHDPTKFLIRDFEGVCEKTYSKYNGRWDLRKETFPEGRGIHDVCGADWWHKANRRWLTRFFGCALNEIFSFELIPYHSKSFDLHKVKGSEFDAYIRERIMLPMGILMRRNGIGCAVLYGASLRNFLNTNATLIATWEKGVGPQGKMDWLLNGKGTPIAHAYKLYKYPVSFLTPGETSPKTYELLLLSLVPAGRGLNYPSKEFEGVENIIKERILHELAHKG